MTATIDHQAEAIGWSAQLGYMTSDGTSRYVIGSDWEGERGYLLLLQERATEAEAETVLAEVQVILDATVDHEALALNTGALSALVVILRADGESLELVEPSDEQVAA